MTNFELFICGSKSNFVWVSGLFFEQVTLSFPIVIEFLSMFFSVLHISSKNWHHLKHFAAQLGEKQSQSNGFVDVQKKCALFD